MSFYVNSFYFNFVVGRFYKFEPQEGMSADDTARAFIREMTAGVSDQDALFQIAKNVYMGVFWIWSRIKDEQFKEIARSIERSDNGPQTMKKIFGLVNRIRPFIKQNIPYFGAFNKDQIKQIKLITENKPPEFISISNFP